MGSRYYFRINGGTVEKCDTDGSPAYFGGVVVINDSKFTMDRGGIENCFPKASADYAGHN